MANKCATMVLAPGCSHCSLTILLGGRCCCWSVSVYQGKVEIKFAPKGVVSVGVRAGMTTGVLIAGPRLVLFHLLSVSIVLVTMPSWTTRILQALEHYQLSTAPQLLDHRFLTAGPCRVTIIAECVAVHVWCCHLLLIDDHSVWNIPKVTIQI